MLNKEQILSTQNLKTKEVDVPEWGGSVVIQEMDVQTFEEMRDSEDKPSLWGFLMARCVVDDSGNRLFTDEDIAGLSLKGYDVMNKLADQILVLSNLSEYASLELEKNLEAALSD